MEELKTRPNIKTPAIYKGKHSGSLILISDKSRPKDIFTCINKDGTTGEISYIDLVNLFEFVMMADFEWIVSMDSMILPKVPEPQPKEDYSDVFISELLSIVKTQADTIKRFESTIYLLVKPKENGN